jgi:hypothetical protein
MNERCKTCKHWNRSKPNFNPTADFGQCVSDKLAESDVTPTLDMLVYEYMEGGAFFTGPEFGCVHHVPAKAK